MLQGKGSRPEAGGPWSVLPRTKSWAQLCGAGRTRRGQGQEEGERETWPQSKFLKLQVPLHTLDLGLYRSGKAARPLRANGGGHQTDRWQGRPAPPGAPQALRTTVHTDPADSWETHTCMYRHTATGRIRASRSGRLQTEPTMLNSEPGHLKKWFRVKEDIKQNRQE